MLTKMKIALAVCGSLIAGGVGLSAAQGFGGGNGGPPQAVLQKYDTNHDGVLEPNERAAMRADRKARRLAEFDTNHDGKLEPNERAAMREARAEKMFKRLDVNGDGMLSFQEFQQARMFKPHRRHRGQGMGMGQGQGGRRAFMQGYQAGAAEEGPQGPQDQGPQNPYAAPAPGYGNGGQP